MSIFNELLPKLFEIANSSRKNLNDELQAALDCLDRFEEDYQNGRRNARDKTQRDKTLMTTLQSIHEDDDESNKIREATTKADDKPTDEGKRERRVSKKRSQDEVEDMLSPEQEKRVKRNASVKAQSFISKQREAEILKELDDEGIAYVSSLAAVNVNLNQKMRREDTLTEKKSRRRKEDDKENAVPLVQIKQEKISIPPEPMDTESLPVNVEVKQEPEKDETAMPPPSAPVPKPRKALQKEKNNNKEDDSAASDSDESVRGRRSTRTRKQIDNPMPPPVAPAPVASARATRAGSRASNRATLLETDKTMPPPEQRPKRTRGRKKLSESSTESEKNSNTRVPVENGPASPADKPRPKRTRRGKNAEKEAEKQEEPNIPKQKDTAANQTPPKEERISQPDSPVLQKPKKDKTEKKTAKSKAAKAKDNEDSAQTHNPASQSEEACGSRLDETKVLVPNDMDKTMVLPNGVYNHAPVTPKSMRVNETVVLESHIRETMILEKHNINDATVVLEKVALPAKTTEDHDSLMTNDNDTLVTDDGSEAEALAARTPPKSAPPAQPTSAVKVKVQQFEEMAARTTRTKTRAQAKMQEDQDTHTPPDKMTKPVLSQETLNKMNNMIFNGKPPQQVSSVSASKPRAIPVPTKPAAPASTSKLSSLSKHREAAEKEKEDARKKKEAMLEAKRELQKKKREEKMANAAAAREAADRERKLAMELAAKERMEKQAHADQGKLERLKEVERKKLELARKVAETEERRRAEEAARRARLADDQRRADAARRKQLEEAEAMKKEAALMAKEIEKKQKEYLEKQKMKQRLEEKSGTPLKNGVLAPSALSPVYMQDGFQHLNSESEDENTTRPVPAWSAPKARKLVLAYQSLIEQSQIDKLFSVRVHSPDLREIFPNIERARLKRTSSAVWRTPTRLPPLPPLAE